MKQVTETKKVIVIGAGNIGSHLLPYIARMSSVGEVWLIDPDTYEEKNLRSQSIALQDISQPKVYIQGRRLLELNPKLVVKVFVREVESMPLGLLRAACLLSCVDNRRTRQFINRWIRRVGTAWIDSGIEVSDLMARISLFLPNHGNSCYECTWNDEHYATLEQVYSCEHMRVPETHPTNAPASLGGLAASLQAISCERLLQGEINSEGSSEEMIFSARWQKLWVHSLPLNSACRFDHAGWEVERVVHSPASLHFADFKDLLQVKRGGPIFFTLPGQSFVRQLSCRRCSHTDSIFYVRRRLSSHQLTCRCGQTRIPSGYDMTERVPLEPLIHQYGNQALDHVGIESGDILSFETNAQVSHIELGGE